MIIDAQDQILGRVATHAAKQALLGEKVNIVNCEKAVVSGTRETVFAVYKRKKELGTFKGPFFFRSPDRFVRRTVRGMLPYKQEKGKVAYKRIMCWNGVPESFAGQKMETVPGAEKTKLPLGKSVTVRDICKHLGGKQ